MLKVYCDLNNINAINCIGTDPKDYKKMYDLNYAKKALLVK